MADRRAALEQLARERSGKSALESYEAKSQKAFEEVTEEEYQEIQSKRKDERFIEYEDDEMDYEDDEEDWKKHGYNEGDDLKKAEEKEKKSKKGKDAKTTKSGGKKKEEAPTEPQISEKQKSFLANWSAKKATTTSTTVTSTPSKSTLVGTSSTSTPKVSTSAPTTDMDALLSNLTAGRTSEMNSTAVPMALDDLLSAKPAMSSSTPAKKSGLGNLLKSSVKSVQRPPQNPMMSPPPATTSRPSASAVDGDSAVEKPSAKKQRTDGPDMAPPRNADAMWSPVTFKNAPAHVPDEFQPKSLLDEYSGDDFFSDEEMQEVVARATQKKAEPKETVAEAKAPQQIIPSAASFAPASADSMAVASGPGSVEVATNQDGHVEMFWIDASEDQYNQPGTVFLFGKVKSGDNFVSCCVIIKNIERNLFFVPKMNDQGELFDEDSLFDETNEFRRMSGITSWAGKMVDRHYAFEVDGVPREKSPYFKVKYAYKDPLFKFDAERARTFSHVFGQRTSALELLLLKRRLMGPCWITIKDPVFATGLKISHCKAEMTLDNPKNISVCKSRLHDAPPPLTAMSISIKTILDPKKNVNEVVSVSMLVHSQVSMDGATDTLNMSHYRVVSGVRPIEGTIMPPKAEVESAEKSWGRAPNTMKRQANERALLSWFMNEVGMIDPDVIIGHNFLGFDLDVLLHRMRDEKISEWSKLGRLKRREMPKLQKAGFMEGFNAAERAVMSGRLVADTYLAAKEHLREKSYSLAELARTQLDKERHEDFGNEPENFKQFFQSGNSVVRLCVANEDDAKLAMFLMFKLTLIPLTKQLTNLAGNLWSRTLTSSRAERIEYLLLHQFHDLKFISPDKASFGKFGGENEKSKDGAATAKKGGKKGKEKETAEVSAVRGEQAENDEDDEDAPARPSGKSKRSPKYAGGLVLDPKRGLYDKFVLLMDFQSLYPSIIQEYNICFTTVERPQNLPDGSHEPARVPERSRLFCATCKAEGKGTGDSCAHRNVLPKVIRQLVERRREVKKLLKSEKNPGLREQFDIRQKALKLTANSMYGCLGFSHSRFLAQPLAELITQKGRETLQRTVDLVEQSLNLEVIYGDTDSVMISTGLDSLSQVRQLGGKVKTEVNKLYRCLEIEVDGIFERILLLRKKKYASVSVSERPDLGPEKYDRKQETKGLDLVRRDWCDLSKDVSQSVLDLILDPSKSREDVVDGIVKRLEQVRDDISKGILSISKFEITKNLTKAPQDYPDAKNQPHVQVALKMAQRGKQVQVGQRIAYVITKGDSSLMAERAADPETVKLDDIDADWYLSQQIHPPVSRLCEFIQGLDSPFLAQCLGLDSSKFHARGKSYSGGHSDPTSSSAETRQAPIPPYLDYDERYKDADRFELTCSAKCPTGKFVFPGILKQCLGTTRASYEGLEVFSCPGCGAEPLGGQHLKIMLSELIRDRYLRRYHEGVSRCDDASCEMHEKGTRHFSTLNGRCPVAGCTGKLVEDYPAKALHNQLSYFHALFDEESASRVLSEIPPPSDGKPGSAPKVSRPTVSDENLQLLAVLKNEVQKYIDRLAFSNVNMKTLFSNLYEGIKRE